MWPVRVLMGLALGAVIVASTHISQSTSVRTINGYHQTRKPEHQKYVACYYQSHSIYRNGDGTFQISDVRPEYCSVLIYAYAGIEQTYEQKYTVKSLDQWADLHDANGKGGYRQLTSLRFTHHVGVSLALGGWKEGGKLYSAMARNQRDRKDFAKNVREYLMTHNFSGLDFDWEFPGIERGGTEQDRFNYVEVLKDLRKEFSLYNLVLSVSISADINSLNSRYDLKGIADNVDKIHIMSYDYHVLTGGVVMPNAPLDEVNKTVEFVLATQIHPEKFALGLSTYGRGYILEENLRSPSENPIGKPSSLNSWSGPYQNHENHQGTGVLGYNEICKYLLSNETWHKRWDNLSQTPYAVNGNKVIVYDDITSLQLKVQLAMSAGLAGVTIWSVDTDDFRGDCAPPNKHNRVDVREYKYPLLNAITYALERGVNAAPAHNSLSLVLLLLMAYVFGFRSSAL